MPRRDRQLPLPLERPSRGGKRTGAGRKPFGLRAGVPHRPRDTVDADHPLHVTLRIRHGLPTLRRRHCFAALAIAFRRGRDRFGFRLIHYSVQADHIHLITEADGDRSLARGMQGLAIRMAKQLNKKLGRRGSVFSDRYHARAVTTPTATRHLLRYVLNNALKHKTWRGGPDPFSSAHFCAHWKEGPVRWPGWPYGVLVAQPSCWLLRTGWHQHGGGPLGVREAPRLT